MGLPSIQLFGIEIHRLTMDEAVRTLGGWMFGRAGIGPCRYVVTPNVDHVVKLQSNIELRAAYRDAALVVADGWPIVAASQMIGRPLEMRVAGADLVPQLLAAGQRDWDEAQHRPNALALDPQPSTLDCQQPSQVPPRLRVFLLGAAPGVAEAAARQIGRHWPGVVVCGVDSPPLGFENDADVCEAIVTKVNESRPHLLVVGFGAPKQEIWLHKHASRLKVPVAIAAGATIDFLAGRQRRAPVWLQRCKMEWLYRVANDPRRLARRYAVDALVFPLLLAREWWRIRKFARAAATY
jgi:N-acetylglucosaminyldiphosphoundecaprenol N-acetyl-beta-D-mannosaminyltransferase